MQRWLVPKCHRSRSSYCLRQKVQVYPDTTLQSVFQLCVKCHFTGTTTKHQHLANKKAARSYLVANENSVFLPERDKKKKVLLRRNFKILELSSVFQELYSDFDPCKTIGLLAAPQAPRGLVSSCPAPKANLHQINRNHPQRTWTFLTKRANVGVHFPWASKKDNFHVLKWGCTCLMVMFVADCSDSNETGIATWMASLKVWRVFFRSETDPPKPGLSTTSLSTKPCFQPIVADGLCLSSRRWPQRLVSHPRPPGLIHNTAQRLEAGGRC